MFKVRLKIPRYTIEKEKYMAALKAKLEVQVRQAARDFVKAAIENIPVDTGQARGTFLPLARALNISIPIDGNGVKGKNQTTGASEQNKLIFKFETTKTLVKFEVDVQLFYFWVNDIFGHPSGAHPPWESIEEGFKAFMKYIHTTAGTRFPKLKDYLKVDIKEFG